MRIVAVAFAVLLSTLPAFAYSCLYVDQDNSDTVSFADELHFTWTVYGGGPVFNCTTPDNTWARGPYPADCVNTRYKSAVTSWYKFYGLPFGAKGSAFIFNGDLWYSTEPNCMAW